MIARAKHIVILGGGFGGVYAAIHLEKIFARDEDVRLRPDQLEAAYVQKQVVRYQDF